MREHLPYSMWGIAGLISNGHVFPESRDTTVALEMDLLEALRRHYANHHRFEQRKSKRIQRAVREWREEHYLLGDCSAEKDLRDDFDWRQEFARNRDLKLWAGIEQQFLSAIANPMTCFILRTGAWYAGPRSVYEFFYPLSKLRDRLRHKWIGLDPLIDRAVDAAGRFMRSRGYKVMFEAVWTSHEVYDHSHTGSCPMQCYKDKDTHCLPPRHERGKSLCKLIGQPVGAKTSAPQIGMHVRFKTA